jgi:hypothetical protein
LGLVIPFKIPETNVEKIKKMLSKKLFSLSKASPT